MSYSSLVWTESFLTGYLTASRTHSDGILSPWDLVPPHLPLKKKVFLEPFIRKSARFKRKQCSLLPLPTERTKNRLDLFGTSTIPLCKRSKMLQKHQSSELTLRSTSLGWTVTSVSQEKTGTLNRERQKKTEKGWSRVILNQLVLMSALDHQSFLPSIATVPETLN